MPQTFNELESPNKLAPTGIEQTEKREGLFIFQERTNTTVGLNSVSGINKQLTIAAPWTSDMNSGLGASFTVIPRKFPTSPQMPDIEEGKQRRTTQMNSKDDRRLKRYSAAEEKLAKTFQNCGAEISPQELQIRALERAASFLSSHAHDARDRAQELQVILAGREMDRVVFETLKRERWMEEKRQLAVEQEKKAVLRHLDVLAKSLHDDASDKETQALTVQARNQVNLVKFLESAQNQKPLHPHTSHAQRLDHVSRSRTITKVSPMRLRTSSAINSLTEFPQHHLRGSISLDGRLSGKLPSSSIFNPRVKPLPKHTLPAHPPLAVVTEYVAFDSSHTCTTTATDYSTMPDELLSTPLTTDTNTLPYVTSSDSSSEREIDSNNQGGTATIFRSAPQIASDNLVDSIHVSLPEYAVDLFTHFEKDMAPLQPISFPSDPQPTSSISRSQRPVSHIPESSSLQVPPPIKQQHSFIKRSSSHRNFRSLVSIPEALSSRLGVEKQSHVITPRSSTTSLATPKDLRGGITTRVKKRLSLLRMH